MDALDMLGSKMTTLGPKFGVFDWAGHTPLPPVATVQLKVAVPPPRWCRWRSRWRWWSPPPSASPR